MIYFIVFFLMLVCVYLFDYRRHRYFSDLSYWAFFVILVVIVGLRYRIGTDSVTYENTYHYIPKLWEIFGYDFETTRFEPGFVIFASIPKSISSDFILMQFFEGIIVNLVIFAFIKKNSSHKFLCLTFYYLILYLNLNTQVMREALAVCLFLLAWPYFRDGKWLQYYLLTLLATVMHTSALFTLLFPLFCIPGIRNGFKLGWQTLVISLIILGVGYLIEANFYNFFMMFSFSARMVDRVNAYSRDTEGGNVLNLMGTIDLFIRTMLFPLLALYFTNKKLKKEKDQERIRKFRKMETLVITSIYFSVLSIPIFIFGRYFNYLGMFCFVVIANWVFNPLQWGRKRYRLKLAYWVVILLPMYIFNFRSYLAPANRSGSLKTYMVYYPYASRLDPYRDTHREAVFRYNDVR